MSKPVTNVEIEDVLSSIRRLVSSSDRVERVEQEETDEVSDKLVLTPSLRVDDVVDADKNYKNQDLEDHSSSGNLSVNGDVEAVEDESLASDELKSDEEFLEFVTRTADAEEASETVDEMHADLTEDAAAEYEDVLENLDEILSENAENSLDIVEETDASESSDDGDQGLGVLTLDTAEEAADDTATKEQSEDLTADNLRRRAAEFEAIVAEKDDQWDPDGSTQDENAAISGGPVPWQDQDEPEVGGATEDGEEKLIDPLSVFDGPLDTSLQAEEASEVADPVETVTDDASDLKAGEAQELVEVDEADLAKVIADAAQDDDETDTEDDMPDAPGVGEAEEIEAELIEPDSNEAELAAFTFRAHDRSARSSGEDQADTKVMPTGAANANTEAAGAIEEALLDEEALRDMVSDIVRQELQGALGERITRNVRKLVRREIHRALASQQLE